MNKLVIIIVLGLQLMIFAPGLCINMVSMSSLPERAQTVKYQPFLLGWCASRNQDEPARGYSFLKCSDLFLYLGDNQLRQKRKDYEVSPLFLFGNEK